MIAFFDNRKPVTVVIFIIFFIVLKLLVFFGMGLGDERTAFIQSSSYHLLVSNQQLSFLVGSLIVLGIALIFNFFMNSSALFSSKRNYTSAALVGLFSSLVLPINIFGKYSTILIIIGAIYLLLINSVKPNKPSDTFFYIGILSGVLALLEHHLIAFVPFIIIAANVSSVVTGKELVKWIGGLLTPGIWYFGSIYILSSGESPFQDFSFNFSFPDFNPLLKINIAVFTLFLYSLFFTFYTLNRIIKLSFMHRKLMMMTMVLLVGTYLTILLSGLVDVTDLIMLLFPSVILGSYNVLTISKKWNIDIIHYIFVVLVIINSLVIP